MKTINRTLWDSEQEWYRVGNRVAWFSSYTGTWTAHNVDEHDHQSSYEDEYSSIDSFLECEPQFAKAYDPYAGAVVSFGILTDNPVFTVWGN